MRNKIYVKIWGGLGDILLATPIFKEFRRQFPGVKIISLCRNKRDLQILKGNPHIDTLRILNFYYRRLYRYLELFRFITVRRYDYSVLKPSFCYKKKASDIIAEMVGIELSDNNIQVYFTREEELKAKNTLSAFKIPVIINITSATSVNKMWPVKKWSELVSEMPEYTFIQLGSPYEEKVEGAIDLRGKTDIRESMALIKYAAGFAGVESFLGHATNAFNKPGVVLFGPTSIAVWGHDNNINLSKHLPCSNCIDWVGEMKCPYGGPCMQLITVQQVKEAIHQQLLHHI
ncbi:MAG TPA: glycosyltransferase family 9 protein [Puia sp.]|nr:glycosyltransferase family 9 protein [Puia sp.]